MKTESEWRAEKEFKRDEAERKRAAASDPKEERRWRAARDKTSGNSRWDRED